MFYVQDLKSLNGTFVNGVRVDSCPLLEGDILQLGGAANTPIGSALKSYRADVNIRYRFTLTDPRGLPPRPQNGKGTLFYYYYYL
jgi:pSer/pThr/pTyr-binding forkhead associated (FHA) protein